MALITTSPNCGLTLNFCVPKVHIVWTCNTINLAAITLADKGAMFYQSGSGYI